MHALRRDEAGFGLIELVIAMVILSIGILAIASAFTAGAIAIRRAGKTGTATAIANAQLERYRALHYCAIYLAPGTVPAVGSSYWTGFSGTLVTSSTCSSETPVAASTARQDLTAGQTPDGHRYRVDTYIVQETPVSVPAAFSQQVKRVTVLVRDWNNLTGRGVRQESTFHLSTGS
jgi:prepilin-type N-terminal cleavage/methylation domain-containing protein